MFVLKLLNKEGIIKFVPCEGNPDSGIREIFAHEIRNPGLWNPEYSSEKLELRIQVPLTKSSESIA